MRVLHAFSLSILFLIVDSLAGITKLTDANNAGTRHASKCTLILTEGDSAKARAVAGLGVVARDNFGVFPLRGKLLDVREAKYDQIMKNDEFQNIKKIMDLQHSKDYSDVASLRYGQLMIMADQVSYPRHCDRKLILTNRVRVGSRRFAHQRTSHQLFHHFFPSLLKIPSFLVEFVTPIVRVSRAVLFSFEAYFPTCVRRSQRANKESTFSPSPSMSNGSKTPDVHR